MMKKIAMAVHGGARESSPFLKAHEKEFEQGLRDAIQAGHDILKKGGTSLDAVIASVCLLEDHPLFNAGRGSALNSEGEVEMDASLMDGQSHRAGAVALVRNIKNPIVLARAVMEKTRHVFLSGRGAIDIAKKSELNFEPDAYFMTDHQYAEFVQESNPANLEKLIERKIGGTVGAVALDKAGNLAAATSTGGTTNCLPGRIGDSCMIGSGCYANESCAISGTGDGEVLITNVIANTIAMYLELKKCSIEDACEYVILKRPRIVEGGIGVIALDAAGNVGMSFNTEIMKRAWISTDEKLHVKIY